MTEASGPRPIGCQARPWLQTLGPDRFTAELGTVMAEIGSLGFEGFETALPWMPLDDPDGFAELRDAAGGLRLAGAHCGGRWWDPDAAAAVDVIAERAALLPGSGCDRLIVSAAGVPPAIDSAGVAEFTRQLSRLGRACAASGVRVAFHNHAVEAADGARLIAAIVDRCPEEEVALGADLGWVAHAGFDVVEFIERFGHRLEYLHLRDQSAGGFIELGRGELDYSAILRALDAAGYSGWLVAESEFGDLWRGETEPIRTARAQYDGITALGDRAGG